jgi:hypothetical protein
MTTTDERPGCLSSLRKLLGFGPPKPEVLPYGLRDHFLSAAEISFYHVLHTAIGDRTVICPKVRMTDILYVSNRRENYSYVGKISQKHVDFLLCDPKSMKPILAIELDDSSHKRTDRAERDAFVNRAFETAGLPLIRIPARKSYHTNEIAGLILPYLDKQARASSADRQ